MIKCTGNAEAHITVLCTSGPRFVLNPIKIFDGSFGGATLWENPHYVSPGAVRIISLSISISHLDHGFYLKNLWPSSLLLFQHRKLLNKSAASKYLSRVTQKTHNEVDRPETTYALNEIDDIFAGDAFEKAKDIVEKEEKEEEIRHLAEESLSPPKKKAKKKPKIAKHADLNGQSPKEKEVKQSPSVPRKGKKIKNHKIAAIKLKKAKAKAAKV